MAACPGCVAVSSSSTESTCLRIRSLLKWAPICGHSMSSPVMSSTESLVFLPAGAEDLSATGSGTADSFFLVALCTDGLRIPQVNSCCTAIRQHSRRRTIERPRMQDPHGNEGLTRRLGSHFGVGRSLSTHPSRPGRGQGENCIAYAAETTGPPSLACHFPPTVRHPPPALRWRLPVPCY